MSESENNGANGAATAESNESAASATEPTTAADSNAPAASSASANPPADPLAAAQAEAARLREQLLRTAADFDNFRKRSRRDVEDAQKKGTEELLRNLLPVFDNLERAVLHAEQAADSKAIADGVKMVLKQFVDTLGRVGIKRVGAVGAPFDPLVHEAIQQIETDEATPGTIVAEVASGYQLGERLIRAAMVVVAKPKSS
jgi:molecular chaperone GrpE